MGISKPPGYKHPGKDTRQQSARQSGKPAAADIPDFPIRKKEGGKPASKSDPDRNGAATQEKTVLMRLVVRPPKAGQLSAYDEIVSAGLAPKVALLGMLKRGFPEFKSEVSKGRFQPVENSIAFEGTAIETTRLVEASFYRMLKSAFDPFDVLTDRAIGQKVGDTIIVAAGNARKR